MPFSSGTYTLPGPALVTGEIVSATENNQFRNDVATALNLTFLRNGTSTATANLPMGGFKLTGLAAGTTAGDSVRYEQFAAPPAIGNTTPNTGAFTTVSASGQVTSTVSTGTAPLIISSTTKVDNLNADLLDGADWASPAAIGSVTPAAGTFTTGTFTTGIFTTAKATAYQETKVAIAASNIDLSLGNYFSKTISGTTTFTVSNVPTTGTAASFILDLTNGGSATINWWTGVKWAGGTAPSLTTSGRDVLGFFTYDGGTTWTGLVLGKDVK